MVAFLMPASPSRKGQRKESISCQTRSWGDDLEGMG